MANRIAKDKQIRILKMLVEGSSMRSITRIERCSINTVTRILEYAGEACLEFHEAHVRGVPPRHVQCDEIWAYIYARRRNVERATAAPEEAGDVWAWTALDSDTKRHEPLVKDDEQALTNDIVGLATRFGRYGYRRVTALLKGAGWQVNHKRVWSCPISCTSDCESFAGHMKSRRRAERATVRRLSENC